MTLTKGQKIIIYVIIGIVIVFFVERFFISGLRSRLTSLNRKVRLAESELRKAMAIQKTKDKIVEDYQRTKPYLEMKAEGDKQIVAQLLKEIESIIRISGGTVVSLNPGERISEANVYSADFRLEVTFSQLLKFLNAIEESKLLIKLDKISITSKDEKAALLRVDGTVSITIP
ncbi:MAG: hypothetical protein JSV34_04025 [Candidatus Omnitrophota bacterium]|nr:MAG: hypothetical protein JSV34_04025 [Candidatus Omnitrophota bacterium]